MDGADVSYIDASPAVASKGLTIEKFDDKHFGYLLLKVDGTSLSIAYTQLRQRRRVTPPIRLRSTWQTRSSSPGRRGSPGQPQRRRVVRKAAPGQPQRRRSFSRSRFRFSGTGRAVLAGLELGQFFRDGFEPLAGGGVVFKIGAAGGNDFSKPDARASDAALHRADFEAQLFRDFMIGAVYNRAQLENFALGGFELFQACRDQGGKFVILRVAHRARGFGGHEDLRKSLRPCRLKSSRAGKRDVAAPAEVIPIAIYERDSRRCGAARL